MSPWEIGEVRKFLDKSRADILGAVRTKLAKDIVKLVFDILNKNLDTEMILSESKMGR